MLFRITFLFLILIFGRAAVAQDLPDYSAKSAQELETLSKTGDAHATYTLGYNLVFGPGEDLTLRQDADWPRALILFNRANREGHIDAASMLSTYYLGQFGHTRDVAASDKVLIASADKGSVLSKLNYARQYYQSEDSAKRSRARTYLKDAAYDPMTQDVAMDMLVDVTYLPGFGQDADFAAARRLAIECTEALPEESYCPYILGRDFDNGWGGEEDSVLSAFYFEKAAENGDRRAMWYTGMNYLNGQGVRKNEETAFQWVEKSAQAEYIDGLISYAVMKATGEGTEVDYDAAFYAYEQAAELGSAHALRGIGVMYLLGEGRQKDREMGTAAIILAADGEEEQAIKILKSYHEAETPEDVEALRLNVAPQIAQIKSKYNLTD